MAKVVCLLFLQLENSKKLHWDCLSQVVRVEKEASQDIRLQVKLMKACLVDQRKFCKDVEPGHMRVQVYNSASACLDSHLPWQSAEVMMGILFAA